MNGLLSDIFFLLCWIFIADQAFLQLQKAESTLVVGEGNGNPLQYYCLENPMDGGAWQAAVHEVAKSQA